jgi:Bax protein
MAPETWDHAFETITLPTTPTAPQLGFLPQSDDHVTVRPGSVAKLATVFQRFGYDLESVRSHGLVPRVYLAMLPPDLASLPDSDQRKAAFIKTVLPLVLHVNETIAHDRARILALRTEFARARTLKVGDAEWLRGVSSSYGLDQDADFDELLLRVDVVPPSLAVAQAALESGWGTSRIAHEGKALFGQYAMYGEGPAQGEDAKNYRIKYFATLSDAVRSYATNLNTHAAYERFRKARAKMRSRGVDPDGYDLAAEIVNYSELRGDYVKAVRRLIDINALSRFDDVRLASRQTL